MSHRYFLFHGATMQLSSFIFTAALLITGVGYCETPAKAPFGTSKKLDMRINSQSNRALRTKASQLSEASVPTRDDRTIKSEDGGRASLDTGKLAELNADKQKLRDTFGANKKPSHHVNNK